MERRVAAAMEAKSQAESGATSVQSQRSATEVAQARKFILRVKAVGSGGLRD